MKHRSIGAFLLLAATFLAIPQAVDDISSLKGAIFEHARGQLFQAFLSFNSDGATPALASRRQPRAASCSDGAKQNLLVASAAKKAAPRASAPARRGESLEPSELTDFIAEEASAAFPLPAFAEFLGEAVEVARELEIAAAPGVGEKTALPPAATAKLKGVDGHGRPQWVSASEREALETASLDLSKAHDILKIDILKEADLARLVGTQRVRHHRLIRRGKPAPPAPLADVPPPPSRQVAESDEAEAAAGATSKGVTWEAEKE